MKRSEVLDCRKQAMLFFDKAGILVTKEECNRLEIADFGLGRYAEIGLGILVYVNTRRCCAKELAMLPWQICPEHRHPWIGGQPGKEETFRCRWGEVAVFVPGGQPAGPGRRVPADKLDCFTVWHEIDLKPGEQFTLPPDTLHWFQAGPEGAVVSEFSTASNDELDIFTDRQIVRIPEMEKD
jgi:D-lyxose ketol-isomerase